MFKIYTISIKDINRFKVNKVNIKKKINRNKYFNNISPFFDCLSCMFYQLRPSSLRFK